MRVQFATDHAAELRGREFVLRFQDGPFSGY
jgi:hypothetical protein